MPDVPAFLRNGGATAELVRTRDWSDTPLGPIECWPDVLKTTLGIVFHSRQPMFLWWGPELIQFYNDAYVPSFGVGKHPAALGQRGRACWPEIWSIIGPQIDDVMQRGLATWHENQLVPIFRNGRIDDVWWTYGYSPVLDASGAVLGTLVVCLETTQAVVSRQQLERAHAEGEAARARLRRLFENAPALVGSLSGPDHVVDMLNPPAARLVGAGREVVRRPLREAMPEVLAQGFIAILDRVYQSGEPFLGHEMPMRFEREGGGPIQSYLNIVFQPRLDASGGVDGIDVFGFEVTDQVRARLAVQELGATNRLMAEAIPQQVWTALPDGALDFVNQRVLEYFDATEEEVLGAGWQAVLHPDDVDACLARWKHSLDTGEPYEIEFRLRRADGEHRWHLGRAVAMRDASGAIVKWFGTNTDIDENERIRLELRERTESEQHLIGIVSHDLRNPLNAIVLGAGVLAQQESLDERSAAIVLRIQSAAHRGGRMIRDLLDFTHARFAGGIPIQPATADLRAVMSQVLEETRAGHPGRELNVAHEGDGAGTWDADRIAQVISNLLSNALHHGARDQPVTVTTRGDEASVVVEIHNLGEPIPEATIPALFHPMKRGAGPLDRSTRSIGLGLYIVSEIVSAHGGSIAVRSTRETGTRFVVTLPRHATAR